MNTAAGYSCLDVSTECRILTPVQPVQPVSTSLSVTVDALSPVNRRDRLLQWQSRTLIWAPRSGKTIPSCFAETLNVTLLTSSDDTSQCQTRDRKCHLAEGEIYILLFRIVGYKHLTAQFVFASRVSCVFIWHDVIKKTRVDFLSVCFLLSLLANPKTY